MNKELLKQLRNRALSTPKILCTGNPDRLGTIAAGVRELFPSAEFVSLSAGYDLSFRTPGSLELFQERIKSYNILINSSFIENGAQEQILSATHAVWRHGHVINVGSTSESDPDNYSRPEYARAKLALRRKSLSLYTYRFRTTHIVLGGIQNEQHPDWLSPVRIAGVIKWILEADFDVPIIGVEPEKDPW